MAFAQSAGPTHDLTAARTHRIIRICERQGNSGDLSEIWRHQRSAPGFPQIIDERYPGHPDGRSIHQTRLRPPLASGDRVRGHRPWSRALAQKAGPAGATRIRARMARAVELATVLGNDKVDQALGLAATAGCFADHDLLSIRGHIADSRPVGEVVRAGEALSVRNGTIGWQAFGQPRHTPTELTAD